MKKRQEPVQAASIEGSQRSAHETRLESRLESQRRANLGLQRQLTAEVQVARRAAEELLKARAEREEYRRVLAAAIANEKLALTGAREARVAVAASEESLRAALLERGTAQGRAAELELRRTESDQRHAAALRAAEARYEKLLEEHTGRVEREVLARGEAEGRVRELLGRIPAEVPPSMRARRARARISLGAAAVSTVLALVFLPAAMVALLSSERAEYLELATGLGGWTLLGIVAGFVAIALGLYTWAVRDLRGSDRASFEATLDAALAAARTESRRVAGSGLGSEAVGHV